MINDIIDFYKSSQETLSLNLSQFRLFDLLQDVVELFQYHSQYKKLNIKYSIEGEVKNLLISNDYLRIKSILINVISNAINVKPRFPEFHPPCPRISQLPFGEFASHAEAVFQTTRKLPVWLQQQGLQHGNTSQQLLLSCCADHLPRFHQNQGAAL